MDNKHLQTLEFPQILARLAKYTSFSAGKELALALWPSPVFAEVQHRLQETREARYLAESHGGISLGGVHDIRPLAQHTKRGGILQPQDLLDVQNTLRVGRRVRRVLTGLQQEVPLLADVAARIEPCTALAEEIARCISQQGEVVDQASPKLARLRREMSTVHERLQQKLNRILSNPQNAPYLQEALITQRSGRYVIPIKTDFKGRIPGLVHDTSASGATLFIEPLSAVEMGNQWRELQIEEQKEVDRILAELAALVADQADELAWSVEALAQLDLILAKGRYAEALLATEPTPLPFKRLDDSQHPGSVLDLRQIRHPLLDQDSVVPIDVHLSEDFFILVITGPNTGGKTVSLKSVGLMIAMAQSGLHLPVAEGSRLSVFDAVFADIGDEQSIEQSLSTFSSHLTNIVRILDEADERSMVLLDELGAGTDPVEGSALARAILSHLLARRITTLVATHYSELKVFAHTTSGVENASVEFDLETLAPTYRMQIGLPGRSNAFAIADRLGLSRTIVDRAQALISAEDLETESMLAEIQEAHQDALAARDESILAKNRVVEQEQRLTTRLATIAAERSAVLGEARAEARRELDEIRNEIERLREELADRKRQSTLTEEWLEQARSRLKEQEQAAAPLPPAPSPEEVALPGEIAVGDTVFVVGLGTTGQVVALEDDSAEVQVGSFGVHVERNELERRSRREESKSESSVTVPATSPTSAPEVELDLRGQRVEEILPRLDKYLDDAFLAGMPFVRIVHGKGTGALRQAVRDQLRDHALVKSYRPGAQGEGGSGVTVVYLSES
jgi:DNA mismatch repair protein MutS2